MGEGEIWFLVLGGKMRFLDIFYFVNEINSYRGSGFLLSGVCGM